MKSIYTLTLPAVTMSLVSACAPHANHAPVRPAPEDTHKAASMAVDIADLDSVMATMQENGGALKGYLATGAAWIPGKPLLVNHDFDFAVAMGLQGVGPGLAAAKRLKNNRETADKLAPRVTTDLFATLRTTLENCDSACAVLQGTRLAVAALLFGQPEARLQTILHIQSQTQDAKPSAAKERSKRALRLIETSKTYSLFGQDGWTTDTGAPLLADQLTNAVQHLIALANKHAIRDQQGDLTIRYPNQTKKPYRCPAGGTEHYKGPLIAQTSWGDLIAAQNPENTFILCADGATPAPQPNR